MDTVFLALRVLLSLAAVLGAIWYVHRRLTKGGRMPRTAKTVNVVTKQAISAKASVVVMDVDGQRFLLGVTEQSVTVLNTSETPQSELGVVQAAARPPLPTSAGQIASAGQIESAGQTVRPAGGAAFARVLAQAQQAPVAATDAEMAPIAYLPEHRNGMLDGSILSAATWKRTADALRRAR